MRCDHHHKTSLFWMSALPPIATAKADIETMCRHVVLSITVLLRKLELRLIEPMPPVCTENVIRIDWLKESPNVMAR